MLFRSVFFFFNLSISRPFSVYSIHVLLRSMRFSQTPTEQVSGKPLALVSIIYVYYGMCINVYTHQFICQESWLFVEYT